MPKLLARSLAAVATLAVATAAWYFAAPPQLGGGTSYAVVYGVSMEPHFHRGDLVLLRRQPAYGVGEVVGYHSRQLHRDVLHRIVAADGDRFTFKGDNNGFRDPEHPLAGQLFGHEWLRIPGAGAQLERLRSPRNAAIVAGLAALLLVGGGGASARRRGRRDGEAAETEQPGLALPPVATGLVAVGGVMLACSLLLAFVAFTRPLERKLVWADLYVQKGTFSYSARTPVGPVYQRAHLRAPDPVFLRLVHGLDVAFRYSTSAKAPARLSGTGRLDAVLTDGAGWRRRVVVQPPRRFSGNHVTLHGRLDLAALSTLIRKFEVQTGEHNTLYKLDLVPRVALHGTVAGRPVQDVFAPPLTLDVDELRLQVERPADGGAQNTLARAKAGAGTRSEPLTIGAFGGRTTVGHARHLAGLAATGGLAMLLLGGGLLLLGRRGDEVAAIRRRYRDSVVDVASGERPAGIERRVATMDALARIAERYDRLILHEGQEGRDSFLVEDDGIVYRYEVESPEEQGGGSPLHPRVHAVAEEEHQ